MARIEIDPNYSAPTFSRATAATDLFKKEDVQALAEALSLHEHGAGKGLAVARLGTGVVSSANIQDLTIVPGDVADNLITLNSRLIQDGAINNAKIQDATIGGTKLAAGGVQRSNLAANAATLAFSTQYLLSSGTTSVSPVIIPSTTLQFTTAGPQLITWSIPVYTNGTAGLYIYMFVNLGVAGALMYANMDAAKGTMCLSGTALLLTGAGNNRFDLGWAVSSASVTASLNAAAPTTLSVLDLAR